MKTFILTSLFALAIPLSASAETEKACFKVEGMTCAACGITLKAAVKKLDGISTVQTDVDNGSAAITFDSDKTTSTSIAEKIDGVGYKATKQSCEQAKS